MSYYEGFLVAFNTLIIPKVFLINILPRLQRNIPHQNYNYFSYVELLFAIIMLISFFTIKKNIENLVDKNKNNFMTEREEKLKEHSKVFFYITLIPFFIELIIIILNATNIIKLYPHDTK
jgi:hypothetical protein